MPSKVAQIVSTQKSTLTWSQRSQLVGLQFTLQPKIEDSLGAQYAVGLHAWLLKQIQKDDPALASHMHDNQDEKNFSISRLHGLAYDHTQTLWVSPKQRYHWQINGFSAPFVQWLGHWARRKPKQLQLYQQTWEIKEIAIALPATTYSQIWSRQIIKSQSLSFLSPTSFRRHGHHVPLPTPTHLLGSYLRRWNQFAPRTFEAFPFLNWVDRHVVISRHELKSTRTTAGKQGLFTGFLGNLELTLDSSAKNEPEYISLFHALCRFAPYCGTGHKTTFGLGFTQRGWSQNWTVHMPNIIETSLVDRIQELSDYFLSLKKRQGGDRGRNSADLWATVYARKEQGERLLAIAEDLDLTYESVRTYSKLAKRALKLRGNH